MPTNKEILTSYKRIIRCRHITLNVISVDYYNEVKNKINGEYYAPIDSLYNGITIDQANYGEDLFLNGSLEDSDYDLLVDIDQI